MSNILHNATVDTLLERRSIRKFKPKPLSDDIVETLETVAQHAASSQFLNDWSAIRITDPALRQAIHAEVEAERQQTAATLPSRQAEFLRLKIEGIRECSELLVSVLMPDDGRHIIGRRTMPDMALASAACAIQNLWLAARAEGIGMGWVSFFEPARLAARLALPTGARPIAVLCLGPVDAFYPRPQFEDAGFGARLPLDDILFENGWPDGAGPTPSAY